MNDSSDQHFLLAGIVDQRTAIHMSLTILARGRIFLNDMKPLGGTRDRKNTPREITMAIM